MPDSMSASAVSSTSRSETNGPKRFHEFQPMGGVGARPSLSTPRPTERRLAPPLSYAARPMSIPYNRLSVRSLDRIAALSDAVFAFAMTLIVLEIHVPDHGPIATDADLWNALGTLAPRFVTYLLSLM